jgi:hypothetical protein
MSQPRIANMSHTAYFFISQIPNQLLMLWSTSCLRSQSSILGHEIQDPTQEYAQHKFSARVLQAESNASVWHKVLPSDIDSDFIMNSVCVSASRTQHPGLTLP